MIRTVVLSLMAGMLAFAAPVVASPTPGAVMPDLDPRTDERSALDPELPIDRPVVATVIDIDSAGQTVMLSTPHGRVALTMPPELVGRLSVGDVVLVRFTDEDDFPSASPGPEPDERPSTMEREKI